MDRYASVDDFYEAHRKASLKEILSRLQGRPADLMRYDDILQKLHLQGQADMGLQEIPLDAIVGSVGRYSDFTRDFLPKRAENKDRWVNVKTAMTGLDGVPPIEVYRVGEVYFVKDGHHRVSVARQMGHEVIQAYVIEVQTLVPLDIDDDPYDLIIKSEYADFLEKTEFQRLFPGEDIRVTLPGQYEKLLEHIQTHRYFMGLEQERYIPCTEAVADWYTRVFLPVKDAILSQGVLRDYPGRKSADLYLWIMEYRGELERELGWQVRDKFLVSFFGKRLARKPWLAWKRGLRAVAAALFHWEERSEERNSEAGQRPVGVEKQGLFEKILVAINDTPASWKTLEQAILICKREQGEIYGLHVTRQKGEDRTALDVIAEKFYRLCEQNQIAGTLAFEPGETAEQILERSYWVDLVVLNLSHPPQEQVIAKLNSGFHTILSGLGRPLLAVPNEEVLALENCLVAYDGSPKSKEALYAAVYIAERWKSRLTLLCVEENEGSSTLIAEQARRYLEVHPITAEIIVRPGAPAETIIAEIERLHADMLIMGSYGYGQVLEVFLGSTVNQVLLKAQVPVLICQ